MKVPHCLSKKKKHIGLKKTRHIEGKRGGVLDVFNCKKKTYNFFF